MRVKVSWFGVDIGVELYRMNGIKDADKLYSQIVVIVSINKV